MSREEILSPEKCILCHKPRRDVKDQLLKEQKPLPKSPYCASCFASTASYYREHLMWVRRDALAREQLLDQDQAQGGGGIGELVGLCRQFLAGLQSPPPLRIIHQSGMGTDGILASGISEHVQEKLDRIGELAVQSGLEDTEDYRMMVMSMLSYGLMEAVSRMLKITLEETLALVPAPAESLAATQ